MAMRSHVRILSLDGGGTRALLTIEMLKELELRTGRRVHELFDLVAGTSTGGILALAIQERIPLEVLERLYLTLADTVFRKEPERLGRLFMAGAAYKCAELENLCRSVLAQARGDADVTHLPCMIERRAEQEREWQQHAASRPAAAPPSSTVRP